MYKEITQFSSSSVSCIYGTQLLVLVQMMLKLTTVTFIVL